MAKLKDDPQVADLIAKSEQRTTRTLTADHVRAVKAVFTAACEARANDRAAVSLLKETQRTIVASLKA
jgi:hypothetical protein